VTPLQNTPSASTYCGSDLESEMVSSGLAVHWFFIQKFTYLHTFPSQINFIYLSHSWQCALQCNYLVFREVSPLCSESTSWYFYRCTFIEPSVHCFPWYNHSLFNCYIQFGILQASILSSPYPKVISNSREKTRAAHNIAGVGAQWIYTMA